jgi:Fe-S cluster assembly iron-binding protein IscA
MPEYEEINQLKEVVSMLEVTEKATEKLREYLEERELDSAIRIFVSQIG